jgi:flagellar basal body-associated protein FliL
MIEILQEHHYCCGVTLVAAVITIIIVIIIIVTFTVTHTVTATVTIIFIFIVKKNNCTFVNQTKNEYKECNHEEPDNLFNLLDTIQYTILLQDLKQK